MYIIIKSNVLIPTASRLVLTRKCEKYLFLHALVKNCYRAQGEALSNVSFERIKREQAKFSLKNFFTCESQSLVLYLCLQIDKSDCWHVDDR